MPKKHIVQLTSEERERCLATVRAGRAAARTIMHAQVLLQADCGPHGSGWTDERIAEACHVTAVTVATIRKTMATEGLEAALAHYRCSERHRPRKLDGHQEAYLIALSRGAPPEGRNGWTLRLLSERMVELGHVSTLSYGTVRRVLKKTDFSPGAASNGASHPGKTPAS